MNDSSAVSTGTFTQLVGNVISENSSAIIHAANRIYAHKQKGQNKNMDKNRRNIHTRLYHP